MGVPWLWVGKWLGGIGRCRRGICASILLGGGGLVLCIILLLIERVSSFYCSYSFCTTKQKIQICLYIKWVPCISNGHTT